MSLWPLPEEERPLKNVAQALFSCFTILRQPKALKTDNVLSYTSEPFQKFCIQMRIGDSTKIPYNPHCEENSSNIKGTDY